MSQTIGLDLIGDIRFGEHQSFTWYPDNALIRATASPWENAYIESFHDKLRDECLNREIFGSLWEARVVIEQWRLYYNAESTTPRAASALIAPSGRILIVILMSQSHPVCR